MPTSRYCANPVFEAMLASYYSQIQLIDILSSAINELMAHLTCNVIGIAQYHSLESNMAAKYSALFQNLSFS